jgi:hypothetical protein
VRDLGNSFDRPDILQNETNGVGSARRDSGAKVPSVRSM